MKMTRQFYIGLIGFMMSSAVIMGQTTTFSGTVFDSETGEKLAGVNVYLAGTTIGAATDMDGSYEFSTTLTGKMNLVASFIGYQTASESVIPGQESDIQFDFQMEPDLFQLDEIKVVASNNEFLKQLEQFKQFFIGYDSFAGRTFIENELVLDFEWNEEKTEITVTSREPLKIINEALGYIYEVDLIDVRFNPETYGGFYRVFPRVIELEPQNRRQDRRWQRNRETSYKGSTRHFFRALANNSVDNSKYTVHPRDGLVEVNDFLQLQRMYPDDWRYVVNNYKLYRITSREFSIGYNLSNNAQKIAENNKKLSTINLTGPGQMIITNKKGFLYNPEHVQFVGKWNNDRFSRFLPLDYEM